MGTRDLYAYYALKLPRCVKIHKQGAAKKATDYKSGVSLQLMVGVYSA